ncbi:MAG: HIT family protein [Patescibacteria group bacterium]
MPDCLFCKIGTHEIQSKVVHEDSETIAFLDIHPLSAGHTVLVSKTHTPTVTTLPSHALSPLIVAVQRVTHIIESALKPDGFNIGWNHGEAGGQTIGHLHIHIIPRWQGDGGGSIHTIVHNPPAEDLESIYKKLKSVT